MSQMQKWSTPIGALGIALLVGAFLLGLVTPTRRDILLLLGGVGIVLIGFYFVARPRDTTRQTSNVRIASQTVNVILIALAVIGILAALNYIVNKQFSQRIDLTANKEHTLSEQSVQILKSLQEPVQITGFFTPRTLQQRQEAETLLKDYQHVSDKVVVQMVDPDENPVLAQKYENALPGTVVFEKGTRTEKVYQPFDENKFTNAILKVTQTQQPAIYFITGHGEYNIADSDPGGLGAVADYLKQVNYKVEPLSLATISDTLPADTRALVIAGATQKFSADDEKRIKDYLEQGGRVLIMADPADDLGMSDLFKEWGLALEDNLVLDPAQNYRGNLPIPVFLSFPVSPLTKGLESYGVFLPGARAIKEVEGADKVATALLTTSPEACAKTDFEKIKQQAELVCEEGDAKGPFVLAYAVEGAGGGGANPDARGRLVVIGNTAFATNRWMTSQDSLGNQQLFGNVVNWLAGQEQLIAIPERDPNLRPLTAFSGNDVNLIMWVSIALIPLALLIIGGLLWWRKR